MCIFCEIVKGNIRSKVVSENDDFIAIESIDPKAPVHILVIPKKHIDKNTCVASSDGSMWNDLISFAFDVVKKFGLDKTGYRFVNNGGGYQMINHEHLHILGGKNWRPSDGL